MIPTMDSTGQSEAVRERFNLVIEKLMIPTEDLLMQGIPQGSGFNLVIEKLMIPTFDFGMPAGTPSLTGFQSRNRETYDSNSRIFRLDR